jgi:hypothetical protein
MFEINSQVLIITFNNGKQAVISLQRPRDRFISAEILSPGGAVLDAGHYSAENLAETLHRIAQEDSGWTPEELTELRIGK